jgi:hypothetical protein
MINSSSVNKILDLCSADSTLSIVTGHGLDGRGVGVQTPVEARFSLHVVLTGSEAHLTSHPVGAGDSFLEVKQTGHEADHSPPNSAKVKNTWICTFTPPYIFIV